MLAEQVECQPPRSSRIHRTQRRGNRVVAVRTTVARALETAAAEDVASSRFRDR